jgi:hypothetical protein
MQSDGALVILSKPQVQTKYHEKGTQLAGHINTLGIKGNSIKRPEEFWGQDEGNAPHKAQNRHNNDQNLF